MYQQVLPDEAASIALAERLAALLDKPARVYLSGEIGAGKTTLIRALLRAKGVAGKIKSPSFAVVEPYLLGEEAIYHFDLYRLADPSELEYLGWRDYFSHAALCLVEWPERAAALLPAPDVHGTLDILPEGRRLTLLANTPYGKTILHHLNLLSEH